MTPNPKHVAILLVWMLAIISFFSMAVITGSAQPVEQTDANISVSLVGEENTSCTETVDSRTAVCSSSLDADDRMTLVLYSNGPQRVTITDAGDFVAGGQVSVRDVTLKDGKNRIEWRINTDAEFVGVGISTPNAIYSEPIQPYKPGLLPGDPSISDTVLVGGTVFLLFAGGMPLTLYAYRRSRGGEKDVI
jgi:hypothetical protein